jgi:hypothetical protein
MRARQACAFARHVDCRAAPARAEGLFDLIDGDGHRQNAADVGFGKIDGHEMLAGFRLKG